MPKHQQSGMQDHMQALTELRQYVRAEQNRPILGASRQSMQQGQQRQQGGGPGMGGLSSLLASLLGGGAGGGMGQQMAGAGATMSGGMPAIETSAIAAGRAQAGPGENPGSLTARRRRAGGGLVPMPGMQNYGMTY